tara:strand:- start:423 stop:686 length:264 start_codon:yes stop_codon:yes gene_type:complete
MGKKTYKLPTPLDKDKLFKQKGFQKAVKDSERPDFEVESIFDLHHCEGKEIKTAPKKKKKNRDKMMESFAKKSNAGNYSTFYKHERF